MDKIGKFLAKLSHEESYKIFHAISDILSGNAEKYDIKKLKGHRDVYRVRIGNVRIIYRSVVDDIEILDVCRRSEKTYRDY